MAEALDRARKHVASRTLDTVEWSRASLMTTSERAGDVRYGSFALDEPTEAERERRRRLADD